MGIILSIVILAGIFWTFDYLNNNPYSELKPLLAIIGIVFLIAAVMSFISP